MQGNIQCHSDICKFLPAVCHNIVFSIFSATAQVKNQFLFSHSLFHFVSEQDASFYAELYKKAGIKGGHVILLNGHDSPYYESTKEQAILALHTYPGGLQIGGGVNPENAGYILVQVPVM